MSRILFFFLLLPLSVFADVGGEIIIPPGTIDKEPVDILTNIISYAIGIAAILGVIGITWGGIQMVLSLGEEEKLKKGKHIMIYSVVGVIIAGLAYGIVSMVGNLRI